MIGRRSFLTGIGAALITAPAIVRAGSLMPVKQMIVDPRMVRISGIDMWGKHVEEFIELRRYCRFMADETTGIMTLPNLREITGISAA